MTESCRPQLFMISLSDHTHLNDPAGNSWTVQSPEQPTKHRWYIICKEKDSLSHWLIYAFPLMCIHLANDWLFSSLFKASRVRPEAVNWGQRSVRPTMATCQQHDPARPGSITGLDYWNNTLHTNTLALGRCSQAIHLPIHIDEITDHNNYSSKGQSKSSIKSKNQKHNRTYMKWGSVSIEITCWKPLLQANRQLQLLFYYFPKCQHF